MLKRMLLLVGILSFLMAPAAFAVMIDFEDAALGVTSELDYDGVTFVGVQDITESASFYGLEVRDFSSFGHGNVLSTDLYDVHIIQANFDTVTDFVQIDTVIDGTVTSEKDVITLAAYDALDNLLGTVTNAPGDATLSIAMAGIAYVQFNDVAGEWGNGYVIDNFEFNRSQQVPEPATLLFIGTGLLGLVGVSRKKYIK